MTDTTTLDQPGEPTPEGDEQLEELPQSDALGAGGVDTEDPVKSRFLLPLLLPALSIAAVALLVLNISRIFLAGNSDAAVVTGILITVSILVGASVIAAVPRLKTSTLAIIVGVLLLVVSFAGFISLGPSLNDSEGGAASGYVPPKGASVGTVAVSAGAGLSFNNVKFTGNYDAPAGVVTIDYGGDAGHTLAIDDPKFAGFELSSTGAGFPKSAKVLLSPGKYTIYCTVPGHEAAGMKATITVAAK